MNEDFSEIIAAVKKFAVDNLSLSTLSDEELEEQIKTITDNMIGNRYVSIKNRVDIAQQVFSSIRGFGLLDTIMNDDTITEVMINGADNIFIEQAGRVKRLDESFESQRKLEDIIQRIVGKAGREVNQSNPIVDTRLPDGSRVNVVLPPIALCGPTVTIRKFSKTPMTIEKLISYGSITREIADKLKLLVEAKYNIFICGGTGSGKTTFLNALSNYIPKDERVITIEDSAELQIRGVDNLVSLETRNANASGAGAVTIRDLIKSSLRMRPERIVVGEVRGGEALDMLQAMNTGHDGSLSTGHANSTQDMLSRLETMVLQGADGLPLEAIRQQISSAIDIIIHLSRLRDHSRKTMEITEVLGFENGQIKLNPLYVFEEDENTTLEKVSGSLKRTSNPNVEEKKDKEVGSQYENKDDFEKTLSGIAISADNNYYYGGECEYILWGGTPSSAVNKTKASIFGIRFILNLIYAMSAPDINALTFEWATVIAGWTVFGVPIVQTVLKIALALAESAYDLNQLCLGKSVPLYKSSTTWAMSPQGMIGIAKDAAAELIENAAKEAGAYLNDSITNIFDKIENTANNKISEIGDDVKKYMNQTIRDVSDKVINATVTPFMNGIKGVLGKIDSSWGKDKIKEELQNCLDKLKEGATDDIYGQAKTVAIEYLEGKIGEVTDTIYDSLQEAAGVKSETIIGKINDLFKTVDSGVNSGTGYISELNDVISNKITELSGDLKKTVTDTLNSTEDNVKEKLNEALNNFSNELSEKVSGGLDKVGESAPNSKTVGDVSNAKAATISLNYKEYLYAFMLIGILANEDNMVARTGYLMQMNISQKMTDAGFNDSDRENFDMTKMYTMVQIHSEADVDSVFMGMFEKKTVNGEESYSLNFDGDGSSTDRLVYNGFIGY